MIKLELYDRDRPVILIERDENCDGGAWARMQEAFARGILGGNPHRLEVKADVVFSELETVREIRRTFGTDVSLGANLSARLKRMSEERAQREESINASTGHSQALIADLKAIGFRRELKPFQLENLARIVSLPHGADFSVPGAGKTTVALANYEIQKKKGRVFRLLVVAPLAAFAVWKEEIGLCLSEVPKVEVQLGADTEVSSSCEILITNYHRLASDYDRIRHWVGAGLTHVVLDEAHRIKRNEDGVHGRAVIDLSFAAVRRDVLTGTPAPQGAYDLVAPIRFLYPGQDRQILPSRAYVERLGREADVLATTQTAISRLFVRTRKDDLQLPGTRIQVLQRPMRPVQQMIYSALMGTYAGLLQLDDRDRHHMRSLGTVVMYLLEAATNPSLLLAGSDKDDLLTFAHPPAQMSGNERVRELLEQYPTYEYPWKYEEVRKMVAAAASQQHKVLVWSSFVRNIKALEKELSQWNPAVIHGGIPLEDNTTGSLGRTREQEILRFRTDENCTVLLANPAACDEGISLHRECHHAIYLDRTFNAGHFLQSQDRIHRLGLPNHTETLFTLLISEQSIDTYVDHRIRSKVAALAQLMNDPGLVQLALPDEDNRDDETNHPIFADDLGAIKRHLELGS